MFREHRVAVVVPCFDVAGHLPGVVSTLPAFVDRVVVVDDGSRDDFDAAIRAIRSDRVTVIRHARNMGLARAMVSGIRAALADGADVVVKVDGDGQMDPAQMARLVELVAAGEADLAKGNRLMRRPHVEGMPYARLSGNLLLSVLAKFASGYWNVSDPSNGYLAIRRELLEEVELDRLGPRYFFETSLLCEANLAGAVVREVPMPARYGAERSSLSVRAAATGFPFLLLRACLRRVALRHFLRDFTPVALFSVVGAVLVTLGAAYGLRGWLYHSALGEATPAGTIAVAGLPVIAGFQLLLQALVLDIGSVPARSPWASAVSGRHGVEIDERSDRDQVAIVEHRHRRRG
jgi:glycosyltransferase involved in cell wall biosynthesis